MNSAKRIATIHHLPRVHERRPAGEHDYSYPGVLPKDKRLDHIRGIRERLMGANNVTRVLGLMLLDRIDRVLPSQLTFREYREGDVYLCMSAVYELVDPTDPHYRTLHNRATMFSVKLEAVSAHFAAELVQRRPPGDYGYDVMLQWCKELNVTPLNERDLGDPSDQLTKMENVHIHLTRRLGMHAVAGTFTQNQQALSYHWHHEGLNYVVTVTGAERTVPPPAEPS